MKDNEVYSLAVAWLCTLKNALLKTKGEGFEIDTGYLKNRKKMKDSDGNFDKGAY